MYATLMQSDTVQPNGHEKSVTSPGVCMLLCCSQIHYSHMVAQKQAHDLGWSARKTKGLEFK